MRALLLLLPVVLAGCGTSVTQREILKRSQAEIARREPWSATATILVKNADDYSRINWKVKAGAFDYSDYPSYKGINFVPGTERELRFSRDGCLLSYSHEGDRCAPVIYTESTETYAVPEK
jgi:hypothetical protein